MLDDTIFALASGAGKAGVAIIRVSGPEAGRAIRSLTGGVLPVPRRATVASLRRHASGDVVDRGLVVWFPGPGSFTGEDVAELHLHGGRAVVDAVCSELAALQGLRPAEPGEFTRRAFEHGKLDLTAAEGLADLVAAETEVQRRQAQAQMEGALGSLYDSWRVRLLDAQARLTAEIDFSDQDLPGGLREAVHAAVDAVRQEIDAHLADRHRGERVREGIKVALVGPPNAGKSSLLNRLAGRDVAIVHDMPGTTRDVIEVPVDLAGYLAVLSDTAGLREAAEWVEAEGVRRATARAAEADVILVIFDATMLPELDSRAVALVDDRAIPIVNKIDCGTTLLPKEVNSRPVSGVSAKTGLGCEALIKRISEKVSREFAGTGAPSLTRARHRQALTECRDALSRFVKTSEAELAAEELRCAAHHLGRITGRVDVEAVLDVVFRDFCIGK